MDNMTLEEALAAADVSTTPVNDILMVDAEARTIIVPASEMLFGVRQDMDAERKHFKCPKIVGDNVDLSNCHIYISYVPSKQDGTYDINEDVGAYLCEDLDVDGDYVTFSWKLSGNVFVKAGYIAFAVYAKQADADGNLQTKWHTTFAIGKVLDTLPDGEQIVEKYADVIEQLLNRMDEVEAIATPEAMQNYVEAYLAENPPSGMTADEKAQLQKNTEDISSLSEEIAGLGDSGTGLTTSVINALLDCFENVAWANENGQTYYNALQSALLENRVSVSGIELSKASANIYTGYSEDVSAVIIPSDASDKTVTWSSSDENIAVVEANGLNATIKGISDGSAIITCTTNDGGYIDTFAVTVATATVENITLNTTQGSLAVGKTVELTATVSPDEVADKTVIWTTSSSSIATVTPSTDTATALIEAVAEGTATITATCGGKSATYTCVVEAVELEEIIPYLTYKPSTDAFEYGYYAESYEALDTSDTSTIKSIISGYNAIVWDCSNAKKIRVVREVISKGYNAASEYDAFNASPEWKWKYVSDVTTSTTTDAAYKLFIPGATGYNNSINAGDFITLGEFELKDGFKFISSTGILISNAGIAANSSANMSTDINDYMTTNGYYMTSKSDTALKIFIVE